MDRNYLVILFYTEFWVTRAKNLASKDTLSPKCGITWVTGLSTDSLTDRQRNRNTDSDQPMAGPSENYDFRSKF